MTMQANPTKGEIIDLEKSYWDAMKAKDGDRTAELSGETKVKDGQDDGRRKMDARGLRLR